MSLVRWKPLLHRSWKESPTFLSDNHRRPMVLRAINLHCSTVAVAIDGRLRQPAVPGVFPIVRAEVSEAPQVVTDANVVFLETYALKRVKTVEGKVSVRLSRVDEEGSSWQAVISCNLEGKWMLHWGVSYCNDFSSEWDQPPLEMRPPSSVPIKDYAIESPLTRASSTLEGEVLHEVCISWGRFSPVSAILFVLREEETGAWFQHKGRDFRIQLVSHLQDEVDNEDGKQRFSIRPGSFDQLSNFMLKPDISRAIEQESNPNHIDPIQRLTRNSDIYEEYSIIKEEFAQNHLRVTVKRSSEADKNFVYFDIDVPGDVTIHWGVCKDEKRRWEIPPPPFPQSTRVFRQKALQTILQSKSDGSGSLGCFSLEKDIRGLLFVLKLNEYTWLNNKGNDFYIPLTSGRNFSNHVSRDSIASDEERPTENEIRDGEQQVYGANDKSSYTAEVIHGIRNLVSGISSERGRKEKNKEAQESILREIEKLAAEAYTIFRSSTSSFVGESSPEAKHSKASGEFSSGTGSGHEILCQGFNWESHKSGKWYWVLKSKVDELASIGFTTVWLPPPTESVSPEGYMPKDLYNLDSRYGSMEELKVLVKRFHDVGIKVIGDVVLNHRCAHYQNSKGVWNLFGGRLSWDDQAIVADDQHFQGRGNKSSGDNFHAAPNIDHSQVFVRTDLKEWLCWLRKEVGYDGWRLDFVRGFWGGYVKDYLEASEPYFAVGEYWDSLSYTYGEMEYNQDAHRQRIIDWMNATNGTAGAFDVTTKGILHTALEKCEYWRLSDKKGKPPGVVGWWPSRAVTFIENHDTGSTQGHWRFPSGKEMQGYTYILTHPGTPTVFYDHVFSHYQQEISKLISLRSRCKIHCRSTVKIVKAEKDIYAAEIDEKITVKIGPGGFEPSSGLRNWILAAEGNGYNVWEAT